MLLLSDKLIDIPIMSLQTGTELARTHDIIVDPRTLTIVAFYVEGQNLEAHPSILHTGDIREVGDIGFIVNDSSVLMSTEGLVRLQEIIDFKFELIDTPVFDKTGHKLGKVDDFAYDPNFFSIQQIYTQQSFFKSLAMASNVVHRSQILSVTNTRIVVDTATIKDAVIGKAKTAQAFVNPFQVARPESTDHQQ